MRKLWWKRLVPYCLFYLFCLVAAPFVVRSATMQDGPTDNGNGRGVEPRLPPRWRNMQTPDNSLWGDAGHRERCWYWWSYWGMVRWLWRNPGYGLAWGPYAYTPGKATTYTTTGDTRIRARDNARAGWYRIESSDGAWEQTTIRQIWRLPICWKIRTGWILGDAEPGKPCLYLLSIRPMPFRKNKNA